MNESLVMELKNTINDLKIEIIQKQQKLDSLLEEYQKLSGEIIEENISED